MSFELVETVTVGAGGAASIEFTSIPQDGTDLVLKVSGRFDTASGFDPLTLALNASTANFTAVRLFGDGSAANSNTFVTGGQVSAATSTANTFSNQSIYISNYTSSSNKSISVDSVAENNATQAFQDLVAMQWANTAAITGLTLTSFSADNFVEGSTASLYKIS